MIYNYIFDVNEYFLDPDPNETIGWKIILPRKIRNLIMIDPESGKVSFTENVKSFEDLPLGIYKIICGFFLITTKKRHPKTKK